MEYDGVVGFVEWWFDGEGIGCVIDWYVYEVVECGWDCVGFDFVWCECGGEVVEIVVMWIGVVIDDCEGFF